VTLVFGLLRLLCWLIAVSLLVARSKVGPLFFSRLSVIESVVSAGAGALLLVVWRWQSRSFPTQMRSLRWLLAKTLFRGCPAWYRDFATKECAEWIEETIGLLLQIQALELFLHAIPPTWQLSLRSAPAWLRFMVLDHDAAISGLEFYRSARLCVEKILKAVVVTTLGQRVLRLKDPTPKQINYYTPKNMEEAEVGASPIWVPLMRIIALQRARAPSRGSWVPLVDKFVSLLVFFLVATKWLHVFGLHLRNVIAFGGVAGLSIALAARTLAQNLISGLLIYISKSIQPGDEVVLINRDLSGIVDTVDWFHTEIVLYDGALVSVPNGEVFDGVIANKSNKRVRVLEAELWVNDATTAQLREMIVAIQTQILESDKDIVQNDEIQQLRKQHKGHLYAYAPQCVLDDVSRSGAKLRLRAYFRPSLRGDDFLEAKSRILLRATEIINVCRGEVALVAGAAPAAATAPDDSGVPEAAAADGRLEVAAVQADLLAAVHLGLDAAQQSSAWP